VTSLFPADTGFITPLIFFSIFVTKIMTAHSKPHSFLPWRSYFSLLRTTEAYESSYFSVRTAEFFFR
ncbi:MAG: hypothetical protein DI579_06085, partial [Lawsonella clevelandensis]